MSIKKVVVKKSAPWIKVNTTFAPDGGKLSIPISVVHLNDIRNRRFKRKEA